MRSGELQDLNLQCKWQVEELKETLTRLASVKVIATRAGGGGKCSP